VLTRWILFLAFCSWDLYLKTLPSIKAKSMFKTRFTPGMGEIEKVGNLESQNLSIKNHLRNNGIKKSCIGSVKISPFRMKKFEINELI
jgi:hypothetical protein